MTSKIKNKQEIEKLEELEFSLYYVFFYQCKIR
jgi:hypothetical protein